MYVFHNRADSKQAVSYKLAAFSNFIPNRRNTTLRKNVIKYRKGVSFCHGIHDSKLSGAHFGRR